jgi:hypothetical protein
LMCPKRPARNAMGSPAGTRENSPPFQRWEAMTQKSCKPRRGERRARWSRRFGDRFRQSATHFLSSLTGLVPPPPGIPAMNRWAIFFRPPGLGFDADSEYRRRPTPAPVPRKPDHSRPKHSRERAAHAVGRAVQSVEGPAHPRG